MLYDMKKILMVLIIFIISFFNIYSNSETNYIDNEPNTILVEQRSLIVRLLDEAKKHLGKPYKWGATGPKMFDCSGFTSYVFKQFGFDITRTSRSQWKNSGKEIKTNNAIPGDLIFFTSKRSKNKVGHVGIVYANENNDLNFIHASNSGVKISYLNESYYKRRFVGIKRII